MRNNAQQCTTMHNNAQQCTTTPGGETPQFTNKAPVERRLIECENSNGEKNKRASALCFLCRRQTQSKIPKCVYSDAFA
eukprot:2729372-Lingulodinium_polyedra.AAC.1